MANNNYLVLILFLNFVQNTSFSIVIKFGVKLSIEFEDISKLPKISLYMSGFCEDYGNLLENRESEGVHGELEGVIGITPPW